MHLSNASIYFITESKLVSTRSPAARISSVVAKASLMPADISSTMLQISLFAAESSSTRVQTFFFVANIRSLSAIARQVRLTFSKRSRFDNGTLTAYDDADVCVDTI